MGLLHRSINKQILMPVCLLSCLLSFFHKAACQDLSSPRFFTFNIQSLSASSAPVIPQQAISTFTPSAVEPNFLYEFALRFPLKLKGDTQLFGEIAHQNEYTSGIYGFDNGDLTDIDPLELFQTSGSLILLHKFNEKWKLINILNVRSNSNRTFNLTAPAMRYSNVSLVEKKTAKGKLGFGGMFSIGQTISILPAFKYEAELNDKWGLDILFPSRILATRNISKSARLLFGARGDAATYFLSGEDDIQTPFANSNFRRISINGIVGFEKQITPMIGFSAEGGVSLPYKGGIFDSRNSSLGLHDFQNRVSPHFNVGFFLSLPR